MLLFIRGRRYFLSIFGSGNFIGWSSEDNHLHDETNLFRARYAGVPSQSPSLELSDWLNLLHLHSAPSSRAHYDTTTLAAFVDFALRSAKFRRRKEWMSFLQWLASHRLPMKEGGREGDGARKQNRGRRKGLVVGRRGGFIWFSDSPLLDRVVLYSYFAILLLLAEKTPFFELRVSRLKNAWD